MKFVLLLLVLAMTSIAYAQEDWITFGSSSPGQGREYYKKSSVERLGEKVKVEVKVEGPSLLKGGIQYAVTTVVYDCQKMTVKEISELYMKTDGKIASLPVDSKEKEVFSNVTYKELAMIVCGQKGKKK